MSVNINFDENWSCYHDATIDNDDMVISALTNATDDLNWSPLVLPHLVTVDRESTTNNKLDKWWYRKQFEWIQSEQQLIQSVCLTFKSSDNSIEVTDESITPSISAAIWFNAVRIFSGALRVSQISIELPKKLFDLDQLENYNHKHTLIVCCINTCLSFHAFLTVPYDIIASIREVQFNTAVGYTTNSAQKDNDISNYVTSVSDIDENVNIVSDSIQLFPTSTNETRRFLDVVTNKTTKEAINSDKTSANNHFNGVNQTSISLLTIVMLIVGTRGDVEPFIA